MPGDIPVDWRYCSLKLVEDGADGGNDDHADQVEEECSKVNHVSLWFLGDYEI